ncbi:hypothetical protein OG389_03445 [Streptomyces sp. NBC_00435]|uniref:hypothetical protein n=1 Tax=Streptomyces sp. NBC_00435 TaxID=2903649 RepID=UPI002E248C75
MSTDPPRHAWLSWTGRRLFAVATLVLGLGVGGTIAFVGADSRGPAGAPEVTVLTRNLYLGGNIARPLSATRGINDPDAVLAAFAHANDALRAIVDQTDFPSRSKLLAAEIAGGAPDLVGLQEVALWRSGPLETDQMGVANAATVDYDYLALLLIDLNRLGHPYEAIQVRQESDVEGPAFQGTPGTASLKEPRDVRLTLRDVILRRSGSPVRVEGVGGGTYRARQDISLAGRRIAFLRGYGFADVHLGDQRLRFINTHLESQSSLTALDQAHELLAGPAAIAGRAVVIACDCNSDPLDHTRKAGDPTPHSATYDLITGQGRFTDQWLLLSASNPGHTAGFSEQVNDPDTRKVDHRVDMVFAKAADGSALTTADGRVTGLEHRSPEGLWASDHAGVQLRLRT